MWLQLQQTLFAAFIATQMRYPLSIHVVPETTETSKAKNKGNAHSDVKNTRVSGSRDDNYQWVLAEPGESCNNVCPGSGGGTIGCSEDLINFIDTDQEIINIGLSTGHFCDTSLGFGESRFPQIASDHGQCSYRRGWTYEPSCHQPTSPPTHRFCACGSDWYVSGLGASCDATCADENAPPCNETALEKCNTHEKVVELAALLGTPCDETHAIFGKEFPSQLPDKKCAYTYGYEATCMENTTIGNSRFCPCRTLAASGDPHLTNVNGEKFDIVKTGISTLLLSPRLIEQKQQNTQLRVDASVQHRGSSRCKGWYILRILISGSLVGEEIRLSTHGYEAKDGLELNIGTTTLRNETEIQEFIAKGKHNMTFYDKRSSLREHHLNNRIKFARLQLHLGGVQLQITWSTGKHIPNALNFGATHLKMIGNDWGGLLGGDDHTWVSQYDPECKKKDYAQIPQLFGEEDSPWEAKASLD